MQNGHDLTVTPQERENVGNSKGGGSVFLGYGHLAVAQQLASFKFARGRGFPYLAPIASYLTKETQDLATGAKQYLFPDPSQYIDPTTRQAQNLDRAPQKVVISYPVLFLLAGAVIFLAIFTITLNASASASVTR